MPATITALERPKTTTEILAATAETPLHLWSHRDRLALEPISAKSRWGDSRWMFDNATHGAKKNQSAIVWDLDLADGSNLIDPKNADLLDWLRRLVWSVFAAPGDGGGGMKLGSLGAIGHGLRYWVACLVAQEIRWPHEITETVVKRYQEHLQGDVVNGGWILGQRGGVKAGHFRRGTVVCKKAPDRGPFCKSASALGIKLG